MNSLLFWIMLMLLLYFAYMLGARQGSATGEAEDEEKPEPKVPPETLDRVQAKLACLPARWHARHAGGR